MITEFTPFLATVGGALIGISCALLLILYGELAGLSGLVRSALTPFKAGSFWKLSFIAGLLLAGIVVKLIAPNLLVGELNLPPWLIILTGLLVGGGTTLANGCTSGHGVCGTSRFSVRSWVATGVFMLVAVITANLVG